MLLGERSQGLNPSDSASSLTFKELQKRIEGAQEKGSLAAVSVSGGVPISNQSFSNPLFDNRELFPTDATLREQNEQTKYLSPTSLHPLPKVASSSSIKSVKSNKSFKSLLGLGKASPETPMVDFMVDIGKEAAKDDTLEGELPVDEISSQTFPEAYGMSVTSMGKTYKCLLTILM